MAEEIRVKPCSACPYRRDVPSGVWAAHEYDKLRDYDNPTGDQPFEGFGCHATPDYFCHGWAVCHMNRGSRYELMSLRIVAAKRMHMIIIPDEVVPLFTSAAEAADHGQRDIEDPDIAARIAADKLVRQHEWLNRPVGEG